MLRYIVVGFVAFCLTVGVLMPLITEAAPHQQQGACSLGISEANITPQRDHYQILLPYLPVPDYDVASVSEFSEIGNAAPAPVTIVSRSAREPLTVRFFTDVSGDMYERQDQPNTSQMASCVFQEFLSEEVLRVREEPTDTFRFGFETLRSSGCSSPFTHDLALLVECFNLLVKGGKFNYATFGQISDTKEIQILFRLRASAPENQETEEIKKHSRLLVLDFSRDQDQGQYWFMPRMNNQEIKNPIRACDANSPYKHDVDDRFALISTTVNRFRSKSVVQASSFRLLTKGDMDSSKDLNQTQPRYAVRVENPKDRVDSCTIKVAANIPERYQGSNEVPLRSWITRFANTILFPLALVSSGMLLASMISLVHQTILDRVEEWLKQQFP